MKIGSHAGETLEEIIERKQQEIDATGRSFWGYGGTACHPTTQVQPFVRSLAAKVPKVFLLMEYIHSVANPQIVPATRFSKDGVNWEPVPEGINVTGSRYAIVLDEIVPGELEIPIEDFVVGVGPSTGKVAHEYLSGPNRQGVLNPFAKNRASGGATNQEN